MLGTILYEDDTMLAIDKPAGVLSIPDRFNPDLPNLIQGLKIKYPTLIPVHRLDKFTSGINIFAKTTEAHRSLSMAFEDRLVEKYYYAIVDGVPAPESGIIDVPLAESMVTRGKMLVNKRGKECKTAYKIEKNFKKYSLMYLRIFTGRMHQIRVHMQYLGNPLVVDALYGNRTELYLSEIKGKSFHLGKFENERPLLSRQPLHAHKIIVPHTITGTPVEITSPMPKDMSAVVNQMEKWIR